MKKTDVIIIGAGMAGLTLAGLLARAGMRVVVVDREDPGQMATEAFDSRTVALSAGTKAILSPLDVWERLAPHGQAITAIDVQEGHEPFILNFDIKDARSNSPKSGSANQSARSSRPKGGSANQDEAFGWILPNAVVRRVLYEAAKSAGASFIQAGLKEIAYTPSVTPLQNKDCIRALLSDGSGISAKLLVGADGRHSRVRALTGIDTVDLDYRQTAHVGLVTHEKPHFGLALERFYPGGPFAVLPFTDGPSGDHRSAVVWTRHAKRKTRLSGQAQEPRIIKSSPSDACQAEASLLTKVDGRGSSQQTSTPSAEDITCMIAPCFDERYGKVTAIGTWAAFPLTLHHAKNFVSPRIALVSDAAHAIHPIAGQGLNLGMRDVHVLAELLATAKAKGEDPGGEDLLESYQRARRGDALAMVAATDLLNRLFGNDIALLRWLRSAGLGLVDRLPPLKRFFMKVAMGR